MIEQAKGVLAEREGADMDRAFAMLRNHARNHNRRLVEIAKDVIAGVLPVGSLDPLPVPPVRQDRSTS